MIHQKNDRNWVRTNISYCENKVGSVFWLIIYNDALRGGVFQNLTKEQAEYCISRMKPYQDSSGRTILDAYDYVTFTNDLFIN